MQRITTRAPLSNADLQTKAVLIRSLQPDEVLYQAPNYRIDYVAAADVFQVEIQSVDYLTAKKDAVTYLTSRGFSMDAVCNLPVMFYLNFNIAQELQGKNIQFNPLAEGC